MRVLVSENPNHDDASVGSGNHAKVWFKDVRATMFYQLFQVAIHFHPSQTQLSIITGSFCGQVGLLLTKCSHYFNDSVESNTFFGYS